MPADLQAYLNEGKVLHRNVREAGVLLLMSNGDAVKLFPSKGRLMTLIRGILKKTKGHKQWNAAHKILEVGLKTPAPVSVEVFSLSDVYESAYIYRYLEKVEPLYDALASETQEGRFYLLDELARQTALLANNDVLFIDFHLKNFLTDEVRNIWWIDPEVKVSRGYVKARFWARMERMHYKCNQGVLSDEEWNRFCAHLREGLREDLR